MKAEREDALVSIAESLKLLIQPDPATRETFICFDCGRTAGPSCGYWGHGIEELGELMKAYEGYQTPTDDALFEAFVGGWEATKDGEDSADRQRIRASYEEWKRR